MLATREAVSVSAFVFQTWICCRIVNKFVPINVCVSNTTTRTVDWWYFRGERLSGRGMLSLIQSKLATLPFRPSLGIANEASTMGPFTVCNYFKACANHCKRCFPSIVWWDLQNKYENHSKDLAELDAKSPFRRVGAICLNKQLLRTIWRNLQSLWCLLER